MKKFLFLPIALLAVVGLLSSCSKNEEDAPPAVTTTQTYTDLSGLQLTVNGAPMLGKTATYTGTGNSGTIVVNSTFDLSNIPGFDPSMAGGVKEVQGPGVIPGSPEMVIRVNGSNSFSGSDENQFCSWSYNGEISANSLKLNITDLKLKNTELVNKWYPLPVKENEEGRVIDNPIYVNWVSSKNLDLMGTPLSSQDAVALLMAIPMLKGGTVTLPHALQDALKEVDFKADGNIIATYVDSTTGQTAVSPANLAQYTVTGSNMLKLYLNPQAIAADVDGKQAPRTSASRAIDFNNIIGNIFAQIAPMLKEGVPMHYTKSGNAMTVYLGSDLLLPFIQQNILPVLKDKETMAMVVEMMKQDPKLALYADLLPMILPSVIDVLENTTTLEVGMNLTSVK